MGGLYGLGGDYPFGSLGSILAPKRKIFVSYHHGGDQNHYNHFSAHFHDKFDVIYDNSVDRLIDSGDCDYVMRRIRENYITGSSCTLVLCGAETPYRKYVDWEIKATLDAQHGLVCVGLPTSLANNGKYIVPDRLHANVQSGYAPFVTWNQLYDAQYGLTHIVNTAVDHASSNVRLLKNDLPMMSYNRARASQPF